jgi:hypothetical protein
MKASILGLVACALLSCASLAEADILSNLVAYYPFTGNATDASGNGNNAVVNGATLVADRLGAANQAYGFNGTSDYLRIADSASLNLTGDLTISAWVKSAVGGSMIFSNMLEVSPHDGYSFRTLQDGKLHFISGDIHLLGNTSVTTDTWRHVAVTLSGTSARFYVDGALDNSGTVGVPTTSSLDQTIGSSQLPFYFWNGALDEVRVFNRALSAPDIQELPEPSAFVLLATSAIGIFAYRRRMRR